VQQRGIDYPVVLDNDYAVWSAFDNHYWPALYQLVRQREPVRERTLEITFRERGAEAYAFAFG
jgi:hypothetical protein